METAELAVTREEYLQHRIESNSIEILRAYLLKITDMTFDGHTVDNSLFCYIFGELLEEHPGLKEDIDKIYPEILICFDKYFHVCFLTKDIGDVRVLKMIY